MDPVWEGVQEQILLVLSLWSFDRKSEGKSLEIEGLLLAAEWDQAVFEQVLGFIRKSKDWQNRVHEDSCVLGTNIRTSWLARPF